MLYKELPLAIQIVIQELPALRKAMKLVVHLYGSSQGKARRLFGGLCAQTYSPSQLILCSMFSHCFPRAITSTTAVLPRWKVDGMKSCICVQQQPAQSALLALTSQMLHFIKRLMDTRVLLIAAKEEVQYCVLMRTQSTCIIIRLR